MSWLEEMAKKQEVVKEILDLLTTTFSIKGSLDHGDKDWSHEEEYEAAKNPFIVNWNMQQIE